MLFLYVQELQQANRLRGTTRVRELLQEAHEPIAVRLEFLIGVEIRIRLQVDTKFASVLPVVNSDGEVIDNPQGDILRYRSSITESYAVVERHEVDPWTDHSSNSCWKTEISRNILAAVTLVPEQICDLAVHLLLKTRNRGFLTHSQFERK
ncbi:hypothetical protein EES47_28935 [Streptomyces sp. ADI98-12]|nr:hypothetical protein EES47_28935 [Streptomyces sp. ADI98-12]